MVSERTSALPPVFDGGLEIDEASGQRGQDAGQAPSARDMPLLTIEQPDVRPVAEVLEPGDAAPVAAPGEALFWARIDCSLRPGPGDVRIEWFRLRVELLPDAAGNRPRAEDMHPWTVEERVLHHVSLKISPKLTFNQIELDLGERDHSYDYAVLEPSISAAGRGGWDLSWDYFAARDSSITGGKRMHALLRAPLSMTRMAARISASADVLVDRRFRWPARLPKNEPAREVELYAAAAGPH